MEPLNISTLKEPSLSSHFTIFFIPRFVQFLIFRLLYDVFPTTCFSGQDTTHIWLVVALTFPNTCLYLIPLVILYLILLYLLTLYLILLLPYTSCYYFPYTSLTNTSLSHTSCFAEIDWFGFLYSTSITILFSTGFRGQDISPVSLVGVLTFPNTCSYFAIPRLVLFPIFRFVSFPMK